MPRYYRKVIRIRAEDSPNVQFYRACQRSGYVPPSGSYQILEGVLTWQEYQKRRVMWDKIRQCIGLDGEFYEGAQTLMYPPEWLNRAERIADELRNRPRTAQAIGIDPAEGGDKTSMAAVDDMGLIELVSKQTPDTSLITGEALAFMQRHNVLPERVCIDRGGGGKQHADRLRSQGYPIRTVAFGEPLLLDFKRGMRHIEEKRENREERTAHKNRRAEMYWLLRDRLDPSLTDEFKGGFGIPSEYSSLRQELSPIPLTYDDEGTHYILSKHRQDEGIQLEGAKKAAHKPTLVDLIGHSPDEADALVLAVYAMTYKAKRVIVGAIG